MLNIIKHFLFYLLAFCSISLSVMATEMNNHIQLIYPLNNAIINANSTFFVGNTNPDATLTINNEPVKVYSNGAFVRVYSLQKGKNTIILKSQLKNNVVTKKITLNVPINKKYGFQKTSILKPQDQKLIVNKAEVPMRKTPYGDRLTPLKKSTILHSVGIINNHYKIKLNSNHYSYVSVHDVNIYDDYFCEKQIIEKIFISEDKKDIIIKIPVKQPSPIKIETEKNNLILSVYNANFILKKILNKSSYISDIKTDVNKIIFQLNANDFQGYNYFFENNNLVLTIKKPFSKGLRGKTIVIDPGHGGKEAGAIGPTNVKEKEINLEISKYLKQELEKYGVNVILTRDADTYVELYERVNIAQKNNADLLISIHNNSLPDGQNPYIMHGTTTYYYQPHAQKLAQIIQNNLLKQTEFKDQGIKIASFVLTRPTYPISILVEVGYMINPYEYEKLLEAKYQKKYAIGIKNGILEYFRL